MCGATKLILPPFALTCRNPKRENIAGPKTPLEQLLWLLLPLGLCLPGPDCRAAFVTAPGTDHSDQFASTVLLT